MYYDNGVNMYVQVYIEVVFGVDNNIVLLQYIQYIYYIVFLFYVYISNFLFSDKCCVYFVVFIDKFRLVYFRLGFI